MHQESSQELLTSSCVTAMIGGKRDPFSSGSNLMQQNVCQLHGFVVIFVDTLQGSFRKNRINVRHVLPGGLGDFSRQDCVFPYWFP